MLQTVWYPLFQNLQSLKNVSRLKQSRKSKNNTLKIVPVNPDNKIRNPKTPTKHVQSSEMTSFQAQNFRLFSSLMLMWDFPPQPHARAQVVSIYLRFISHSQEESKNHT